MIIRPLVAADWSAVAAIHRAGIAGGDATFESEPPSWERFDAGRRRERIAPMGYGPHAGRWRDTILIEWRAASDPIDPLAP
jgi:L-amino acid N-acyltransferase YncA